MDAFLNAGTTTFIQTDQRAASLGSQIHDLANLLGKNFSERAPKKGAVMRKEIDGSAINLGASGYHSVAGPGFACHIKLVAAVGGKSIEFDKRIEVYQSVNPFAGGKLTPGMLSFSGCFLLLAFLLALADEEIERINLIEFHDQPMV
jgi:hypothetical protein